MSIADALLVGTGQYGGPGAEPSAARRAGISGRKSRRVKRGAAAAKFGHGTLAAAMAVYLRHVGDVTVADIVFGRACPLSKRPK